MISQERIRNAQQSGWLKVNRFKERAFGVIQSDDGSDCFVHLYSFLGLGTDISQETINALELRRRLTFRLKIDQRRGRVTAADVRILDEISDPQGGIIVLSPPEATEKAKHRSGFRSLVAQLR